LKAHENLAELFSSHLNSCPQAVAQYDQIIEEEGQGGKDLSKYFAGKARCYFLQEDWGNALNAYLEIVRSYPEGQYADKAAYQIGYVLYLKERYEEAEKAFRYFLETYPKSEWAFDGMLHLARAKEKQHRTKESEILYQHLRKRFPERAGEVKDNTK